MKFKFLAAFALPFFFSFNIYGQEESNSYVEEVVVTGSNIQRSGYTAISPVQVKSRDEMLAEGATLEK